MDDDVVRAHVFVEGRVQGVFFRWETRTMAQSSSLAGWIRNLPDGRVEAVIEGSRSSVQRLISWMRKGPPAAEVSRVEVDWQEPSGLQGFEVQ